MKNKWFRLLVCFVLVVCILVNISPIKAEAVTGVALTGWAILALTAALGAGVVLNPATPQIANAIGVTLSETAQRVVPDGWETISKVCDHLDNMTPEWDPGDYHNDLKTALAGGLLTAITAMIVAAVTDGVVNVEPDIALGASLTSTSFSFWKDSEPNSVINVETSVPVVLAHFTYKYGDYFGSSVYVGSSSSGTANVDDYDYFLESLSGVYLRSVRSISGISEEYLENYSFSASGIYIENIYLGEVDSGSVKSKVAEHFASILGIEVIPVYPEIYVGDIPTQIENGETDEEKLNIPIIDPSKFVTSPDTAYEEITNVAQQMKDGTVTYNDYVTNYQYVPTTDPDTGTDSSEPSTSTEPSEPEETQPEEDEEKPAEEFSLDLTDFFPFCIPFDIYDFFSILSASPQAPVFDWPIVVPQLGLNYTISIDLTPWDDVAALFRKMELMAFIVGLGFVTRKNFLRG